MDGHIGYIRLVVADFAPSASYEAIKFHTDADRGDGSNAKGKHDQRYYFSFQFSKKDIFAVNFVSSI